MSLTFTFGETTLCFRRRHLPSQPGYYLITCVGDCKRAECFPSNMSLLDGLAAPIYNQIILREQI